MIPLLRASHLPPTLAVTALTTALAVSAGRGAGAAWLGLAVLAGQLSVGWSNDHLDRDRDRQTGRLDKPIVTGAVRSETVRRAAALAAAACVPLSMASGWRSGVAHLAAVAVAWTYNLGLKRTASSVVPYLVSFGLLPSFVTLGLPGHPWPAAWGTVCGALLGAGAHFVNVLPDLDDDVRTGIRGLPHRLGWTASLLTGTVLLAAATALAATAPPGRPSHLVLLLGAAAATAIAVVVVTSVAGRHRVAWPFVLGAAAACVAMLLAQGGQLA